MLGLGIGFFFKNVVLDLGFGVLGVGFGDWSDGGWGLRNDLWGLVEDARFESGEFIVMLTFKEVSSILLCPK